MRLSETGEQLFADAVDMLTDIVFFGAGDLKRISKSAMRLRNLGPHKITMYDCAYLHLALSADSPLLTADRSRAAGAKLLGISVTFIGDYH